MKIPAWDERNESHFTIFCVCFSFIPELWSEFRSIYMIYAEAIPNACCSSLFPFNGRNTVAPQATMLYHFLLSVLFSYSLRFLRFRWRSSFLWNNNTFVPSGRAATTLLLLPFFPSLSLTWYMLVSGLVAVSFLASILLWRLECYRDMMLSSDLLTDASVVIN